MHLGLPRQAERELERLTLSARLASSETYQLPSAELLEAPAKQAADLTAGIDAAEARRLEAEQALERN